MGERLEALRGKTLQAEKQLARGWQVGDDRHRQQLLRQIEGKTRKGHRSLYRQHDAQSQAETIVLEELKKRRWTAQELARRRKSDQDKIMIAQRLRRETTVTIDWIAKRLHMGTTNSLSTVLSRIKKSRA